MASHLREVRSLGLDRAADTDRPARPGPAPAPAPGSQAFAVVLYFDDMTEQRVKQAWEALDKHGVPSAGTTYEEGYRPHITLAMLTTTDPEQAAARLRAPLAHVHGLPVSMTALGFFLTNKAPAYLSVAPTTRLLRLHDEVHTALGGMDTWSYYRPGNWMPHCTLAMDVVDQTTVADALGETPLPIHATVGSAHMVELPKQPAEAQRQLKERNLRRPTGLHRLQVEAPEPRRAPRPQPGRRRRAI